MLEAVNTMTDVAAFINESKRRKDIGKFLSLFLFECHLQIAISHPFYYLTARCLKITERVSFYIASEASYVYIHIRGKKLIKNAKSGPFWRVFENLKLAAKQCYQTGQF